MKFRPGYLALAPLAPLGAAVAHAVLMPKKKSAYQPQPDADRAMAYAEKLAAMIRCDTTSYANVYDPERFERFHAQLAQLFPLVHEKLERTVIDGNLLFYWKGKAHDRPIVLMSHQDVVPAEGTWSHAPFSGDIADGKVDKDDNPLKNAPHTAAEVMSDKWNHKYSRELAAYPCADARDNKYWPTCGKVDNTWGDRKLLFTVDSYHN